jgi:hypothetical protein
MTGMISRSTLDKNTPSALTAGSASGAWGAPLDVAACIEVELAFAPCKLESSTCISPVGKRVLKN